MKKYIYLSFSILFIFLGCSPRVATKLSSSLKPLDFREDVIVLNLDDPEPNQSAHIGSVKVGDSGMTLKCDYQTVLEKAIEATRKAGGNVLHITKHTSPDLLSSCHRIQAEMYYVADKENLATYSQIHLEEDQLLDIDHALLHVYRFGGTGAMVGYDLYLGDSVICRVKNNFKTTIPIHKDGLNMLWAKTEAKAEVPINVKIGKEYFLRCSVGMGVFVGQPRLELMEPTLGRREFFSFNAKNE